MNVIVVVEDERGRMAREERRIWRREEERRMEGDIETDGKGERMLKKRSCHSLH